MNCSPLRKIAATALSVVLVCGLCPAVSLAQETERSQDRSVQLDESSDVSEGAAELLGEGEEAADADSALTVDADKASVLDQGELFDSEQGGEEAVENVSDIALFASNGNDGTQPDSGYCGTTDKGADGTNISWSYDGAGTLTLSGTGSTDFYSEYDSFWGFSSPVPGWYDYRTSITNVVIGEGITTLDSALLAHTSITSITLPSSVKELGQLVFAGCTRLKDVRLNEGLESIGVQAFNNTALDSLYIPSTVSSIDSTVFRGIDVSDVTISSSNPYLTIYDNPCTLLTKQN